MGSLLYNKDPMAIVKSMGSYFKQRPPDCGLFSEDGYEIPLHKELLFQTTLMCQMLKNVDMDCCKITIMCPSLAKEELENIVEFLYGGKINCTNFTDATHVFNNLTQLFGFPSRNFEFNGTILKAEFEESDVTISNDNPVSNFNILHTYLHKSIHFDITSLIFVYRYFILTLMIARTT